MASKQQIWNPEILDYRDSVREYEEYRVTAIMRDDVWGHTHNEGVTLILFVDALTGIVVNDIAQYENTL